MMRVYFVAEWSPALWLVTDDDERRYLVSVGDLATDLTGALRVGRGRALEVPR